MSTWERKPQNRTNQDHRLSAGWGLLSTHLHRLLGKSSPAIDIASLTLSGYVFSFALISTAYPTRKKITVKSAKLYFRKVPQHTRVSF